jgi:hypothetical protein
MTALGWLDDLDAGPRWALVGLTGGSLLVGTALLEQLDQPVLVLDAIAAGWLGGLGLLWAGARWRATPRVRARARARREELEAQLHERGLLVGGAVPDGRAGIGRLALDDPSFTLPDTLHWAWLLYVAAQTSPHPLPWLDVQIPLGFGLDGLGELHVLGVTRSGADVRLDVLVITANAAGETAPVHLTLERSAQASSRPPDELGSLDRADHRDDWHLIWSAPGWQPEPAQPSPHLAADLRTLALRSADFDADAIADRVRTMATELAEGDLVRLASRCTPTGSLAVEVPRALGDDLDVTWISADSDAVMERVELSHRGLCFGLCRRLGSDDDWLLWRLSGGLS